jgi:hypothetical protein
MTKFVEFKADSTEKISIIISINIDMISSFHCLDDVDLTKILLSDSREYFIVNHTYEEVKKMIQEARN